MRLMLVAALALSLPACTFVHMAPSAGKVKVLASAPSCEKRGEAEVSVRHKVGFYERSEAQVRDELETLRRQLARAHQPLDVVNEVAEVVETLEEELAEPIVRQAPKKPVRKTKGPLHLGEKVHLRSIDQDGVVTGITEADIEVQVGMLRIRARRSDIIRKGETEEDPPELQKDRTKPGKTILPRTHESPGFELDMRGQRVDAGLATLQGDLEKAFLAGLPFVRIIHGKGTGRLRESVREALRLSPFVDRYESGGDTEGGAGVTVAFIKQN